MKLTEILKKINKVKEEPIARSVLLKFKDEARDAIIGICQKQHDCPGCYFAIKSNGYVFCSLYIAQEQVIRDGSPSSPNCWEK